MEKQLNREVYDEIFYIEKYRTFVVLWEKDQVFEINYNGKPNKWWDIDDFVASEIRFADLEEKGEWSDAWLARGYKIEHSKKMRELMRIKASGRSDRFLLEQKLTNDDIEKIKQKTFRELFPEVKYNQLIRCPFHNDKTSSLKFYPNNFYCFGCNKNGSVIDWYMHIHNVSFRTALQELIKQ